MSTACTEHRKRHLNAVKNSTTNRILFSVCLSVSLCLSLFTPATINAAAPATAADYPSHSLILSFFFSLARSLSIPFLYSLLALLQLFVNQHPLSHEVQLFLSILSLSLLTQIKYSRHLNARGQDIDQFNWRLHIHYQLETGLVGQRDRARQSERR